MDSEDFDDSGSEQDYSDDDDADLETKLNVNQQNILREQNLKNEKLRLLLQYNASGYNGAPVIIEEEVFRGELKRINNELVQIDVLYDEVNDLLAEREIEYNSLLDEYQSKLKQGTKLSPDEIEKINALKTLVNKILEQYFESLDPLEPEDPFEYDSEGYTENWEYYEAEELKEMQNLVKRLGLKVTAPQESQFKNKNDYITAWNKFWAFITPYIPVYRTNLNITRPGTKTEQIENKTPIESIYQGIDDLKNSKIKLSEEDVSQVKKIKEMKNSLNAMESNELIDCIFNSTAIADGGWSYIEKLRNNKTRVLKINEKIFPMGRKEPVGLQKTLIDLLNTLGFSVTGSESVNELQDILETKYDLPQRLYYNNSVSFEIPFFKPNGEEKIIKIKNPSRSAIVKILRYPVPAGIKVSNELFYEKYLPVPKDYLLSGVQEVWMLPVRLPDGKTILMKYSYFEDYLIEIKRRLLELEQTEMVKDKIYQIEHYIEKGITLPAYRLRKEQEIGIQQFNGILPWQRKITLKKLEKVFPKDSAITLERFVHSKFPKNAYFQKIENIIFIVNTYPEYRTKYIKDPVQIALIDKIKVNISTRTKSLQKIKNTLDSSMNVRYFRNSRILKNVILNNQSKKIELMLYDLSDTNTEYLYIVDKLLGLLRIESIALDLVRDNPLQLVTIVRRFKLNEKIVIKSNKVNLRDVSLMNLKQYSLAELDSLLSYERLHLKELLKEKTLHNYHNLKDQYALLWKPSYLNNSEMNKLAELKKKANKLINKVNKVFSKMVGPTLDVEPKDVNGYLKRLFSGKESMILADYIVRDIATRPLNIFKQYLLKKYKIYIKSVKNEIDKSIASIKVDITRTKEIISKLQRARIDKLLLLNKVKRLFIKKYTTQKLSVFKPKTSSDYNFVNYESIFQLVQAFKRNLIVQDILSKEKGKLIENLELLDFNDLSLQNKQVDAIVYNKIKAIALSGLPPPPEKAYFKEAVEKITEKLNITISWDLDPIQQLVDKWPSATLQNREIISFYGEDLFSKLKKITNAIDFYDAKFRRYYAKIVSENKPQQKQENTRRMTIYNPQTRKFGISASDGYLFDVYRLEEDPATGNPFIIDNLVDVFNPRIGTTVTVPVQIEKPGKVYYLKFPIINPSDENDTFRWMKVQPQYVNMYPLNYDSCSRFNNEKDCNSGTGLGGNKCYYDSTGKICKVRYLTK
jgi:DUF1009 family protein